MQAASGSSEVIGTPEVDVDNFVVFVVVKVFFGILRGRAAARCAVIRRFRCFAGSEQRQHDRCCQQQAEKLFEFVHRI